MQISRTNLVENQNNDKTKEKLKESIYETHQSGKEEMVIFSHHAHRQQLQQKEREREKLNLHLHQHPPFKQILHHSYYEQITHRFHFHSLSHHL